MVMTHYFIKIELYFLKCHERHRKAEKMFQIKEAKKTWKLNVTTDPRWDLELKEKCYNEHYEFSW